MTTYLPFSPSFVPNQPPWTSPVTLDGSQYTLAAKWNIFSQEWYVELDAPTQATPVFFLPMIGSPAPIAIESLIWQPGAPGASGTLVTIPLPVSSQQGTAIATSTIPLPLGVGFGAVVDLMILGAIPAAFSGPQRCVVLNDTQFSYPLVTNPGTPASAPGYYSYDINLAEGYFLSSTLVWRPSSSWFEVNP